jgi:protein-S-isoprenylcysteine O-methyltransferase Ste14
MEKLRVVAWLTCGIYATIPSYWMMVHPFAARWRTARYKLTLLGPLWIGMWCVAWAASYAWRDALIYDASRMWMASLLLWVVTVFMYVNALRGLTLKRVIGRHELEPETQTDTLVTSGVHGLVRHPMYLGHICTMFGFAIGTGTWACYGLMAFAMVTGAVMIRYEERELHARFGQAWEKYCERTPAIFPLPKH